VPHLGYTQGAPRRLVAYSTTPSAAPSMRNSIGVRDRLQVTTTYLRPEFRVLGPFVHRTTREPPPWCPPRLPADEASAIGPLRVAICDRTASNHMSTATGAGVAPTYGRHHCGRMPLANPSWRATESGSRVVFAFATLIHQERVTALSRSLPWEFGCSIAADDEC